MRLFMNLNFGRLCVWCYDYAVTKMAFAVQTARQPSMKIGFSGGRDEEKYGFYGYD